MRNHLFTPLSGYPGTAADPLRLPGRRRQIQKVTSMLMGGLLCIWAPFSTSAWAVSGENSLTSVQATDTQVTALITSPAEGYQVPRAITVNGRVTDENNEGLPGVTVLVKGSSVGTSTNTAGEYSISVPDGNATLVFSFIGYVSKEEPVNNRTQINITLLPDIKSLDEVVVVGYGTQRKADVSVAVGSVQGDAIAERGTVNPLQAVQGQVAGVDISAGSGRAGANYNIQIRGQNSLAGGNPLYVVDGVIVSDINFLNPQDIEKLDILKDAASTAIYGSRGSNGVVLVTTKQGSTVKGGATISYDGYVGIRQVARMPDFMDGDQWWEYRQNAFITPELLAGRTNFDNTIGGLSTSPTLTQRIANKEYTNWRDLVLRTGVQNNHWLTISGISNNNMQYLIGAGYQNEKGNLINEYYDRFNFKASLDHKLSDKFSAGTSFNFSLSETELGSDLAVTNAFRMSPVTAPYDAAGNLVFRPGQIEGTSMTSSVNPLLDNANSENNTRRAFGVGNLYLQYSPIKWIDVRSTFSPRVNFVRNGRFWGSQTEARGGLQPAAQRINEQSMAYIWDNMITASRSFNKHNFTFTGLHSMQRERYEYDTTRVNDLPFNSSFYNLGSSANRQIAASAFSQFSILSYMARLNYSFNDKYLLTLATRWDGSSKLARGHKWSSFPSAAVAWRISEENFMKGIGFLSELKARFSVGVAGNNNNINPYETQMNLNAPAFYDFGGTLALGYAPNRLPNPALTWERTREYNLGVDYSFFQGRISGSIDVYDKLSRGLLMRRDIPLESGWTSIKDNVGSVSNKGIELSLRTVNVSTKDFTWTTTFNFAKNDNAIVELLGKKEDLPGNAWFIGQPINVNYTYVFDGIWQESERDAALAYKQLPGQARVLDLNKDGIISNEDRTIIGQRNPKWTGGLSSQMTFKGFDLSASLFTRQGVQVNSPFHAEFTNLADRGRAKLDVNYYMAENHVTPARSSNEYPQPANVGPYWTAVGYYRDVSFVKVQNILLGYNLPSSLVERIRLKRLRVYANVLNPFVWTKFDGFDPEYAIESSTPSNPNNPQSQGNLNSTGPSAITYQFGLNVQF